jgi:DNA polymerase-1
MAPPPGDALVYCDYSAMEFGIAAALSGDVNMTTFYNSGDPYLATAVAAGAVEPGATKRSHPVERDLFKTGNLSCLFGIGVKTLASRLRRPLQFAAEFLDTNHRLFATYWSWSDGVVRQAVHSGIYCSRHGWSYIVQPPIQPRSLRNWVIQTMGADCLRLACIMADACGIEMLATAHRRGSVRVADRPRGARCCGDG